MQKFLRLFVLLSIILVILAPLKSNAKLGVGVGTGKIEMDKPLKPGGLYNLPSLTVINTGDEPSGFSVSVEYKGDQPRMSPPKEWFVFSPNTFHLEAGQSQIVQVQLNIPIKTIPADYFAYLRGFPMQINNTAGGATIGIGAAAKLYFTVAPANIFQGVYYRIIAIIKNNAPWSYIVLAVALMSILITLFRRYFSFNFGINLKRKDEKSPQELAEELDFKSYRESLKVNKEKEAKLNDEKSEK